MDIKRSLPGTKNPSTFVIGICLLTFGLNSVLCDMFCPPAIENAAYNVTVEKYNLATRDLNGLTPRWYIGNELLASCNFTTHLCTANNSVRKLPLTFEVLIFGDDDVQMTLLIARFTPDLQQTVSVQWDNGTTTSYDSCQVNIGGPIDECVTQTPCLNGASCFDVAIGYRCMCTEGYSGKTCREGDLKLRCKPSSYRIVFNQQIDLCVDFNITCFVAGVDYQENIAVNGFETSNNGSSDVSLSPTFSGNIVFFKLCITSSTHFGNYEILYSLQSNRAVSSFSFQILPELTNVNTAPGFNTPGANVPYVFDVPENTRPGSTVIQVQKSQTQSCTQDVCIQVLDPDINDVDSLILTVSLESQQTAQIAYRNNNTSSSFGYFYVSAQLTPSTSISFRLTVTDGNQASASTIVIFRVTDVNNPPVCKTDVISLDLDIRVQPVTNLGAVLCSDNDSVEASRHITYNIEGQFARYFSVSSTGTISMYQSVLGLEPGLLMFNVTATGYSALPDPAFVFSIPVHVNITVPAPQCSLSISSIPDNWTANVDAMLQLECDISGVDKLRVVSWNHQNVFNATFTKASSTVYTVKLTVTRYSPAVYNFEVLASLGGASSAASVMLKMYNRPRFNAHAYNITITDMTPAGNIILAVSAVTEMQNATLTYRIKSGNDESLFSLSTSGTLSMAQKPLLFAGSTFRLVCEVQDSISGLNDTMEVQIVIIDTNEPPDCGNPGPVMINSNLAPGSVITKVLCHDSDITPGFKNWSYSISVGQSAAELGIRNNGEVILQKTLPAGTIFISVTVNVSDIDLYTSVQFNITVTVIKCPTEAAEFGLFFPETPVNSVINVSCPNTYTGEVSRSCHLNQTWGTFNYNSCRRKDIADATALLAQLKANTSHVSPDEATATVKTVADLLAESLAKTGTVLSGDIKQMVVLLGDVGKVTELYETASLADETLESFASSSDSIIGADVKMWQQALIEEDEEGAQMLQAMDSITSASVRNASFGEEPVVRENLAIKRAISQDDIVFPDVQEDAYQNYSGWVLNSNSTAFLSKTAFQSKTDTVRYSIIVYKNVVDKFKANSKLQNGNLSGKVLNSDILSFSIDADLATISPPLLISFSILQTNYSDPSCGYLNTSTSVVGVWETKGCTPQVFNDRIQCSCNHLTNFAVLMSPFGKRSISSRDETILSIISAIGCGISIFCLVITVIIYMILWKYLKCDRAVLHVNLSLCLILAYVVFLVGVDRTESEVGCKVVAALLHYLFLVVFFTMLCEGIEVFKSVTFVFSSESIICQLLSVSYGVPTIIVAVSLGVTRTKGYGSETTCWLSVDNGLIWAFVGPALLVILINFIILVRVLRIMQNSKQMMVKTAQQRTKSVVRTICVLSPLLGLTWVFGVLSVSEETVVFQYLFAIFNSLQGLFIFICYCLLTPQVRDGFKAMRRKYRAKSFDSTQRVVSSSYSGKYSESESHLPNHRKSHGDFKSSANTRTTSVKDSSQTVSSDCISDSGEYRNHYGRQESTDSRNSHRSGSDSVFSHHTAIGNRGEIPLSSTDPRSRSGSQAKEGVSPSYTGGFLSSNNRQISGQGQMYHGSLFSASDKNTHSC